MSATRTRPAAARRRRPRSPGRRRRLNALDPAIWPAALRDRRLASAAAYRPGRPSTARRRCCSTSTTCAPAPGPTSSAFAGADVYYAGKAFLCTAVARWIDDEGLGLDVCTGGELAVALAAGFPPERIALHGNNKSVAELAPRGRRRGRPDRRRLVRRDRPAGRDRRRGRTRRSGCWSGSPSASRRTPTSSSRPRTRTRSSASRLRDGAADEAVAAGARRRRRSSSPACTRTSARRSSTPPASRSPRTAWSSWPRAIRDEHGIEVRRARPRRRPRHRLRRPSDDPPTSPRRSASGCARSSSASAPRLGLPVPRLAVEPGRAIVGPAAITLYEVGTVKPVRSTAAPAHLRVGRRRHERQHPHRALRRQLHRACWPAATSDAPADAGPGGRQALRERRHRGARRLAAGRPRARRPARGRRDRRLLPLAWPATTTTSPRPPVVAVRDGAIAACSSAARPTTTCCDSTRAGAPERTAPMADSLRVALLGCGVVGSQVARLLHEQADDLAARVGAPLELVGIAVRRPEPPPATIAGRRCSPTDAAGAGRARPTSTSWSR